MLFLYLVIIECWLALCDKLVRLINYYFFDECTLFLHMFWEAIQYGFRRASVSTDANHSLGCVVKYSGVFTYSGWVAGKFVRFLSVSDFVRYARRKNYFESSSFIASTSILLHVFLCILYHSLKITIENI